ncbi:hypothetical protein BDV95DRAFT_473428, partial [Massariosphaeria phaeospora]
ALRKRLLDDIGELENDPYPNIYLHVHDADVTLACLVLTPFNQQALHLTIKFYNDYPLRAPKVTIQSKVDHPNVFGNSICATMLNSDEGWTPAYTLKGVAIQLLSFFSSERLEQDHGSSRFVELSQYRKKPDWGHSHQHYCEVCRFGTDEEDDYIYGRIWRKYENFCLRARRERMMQSSSGEKKRRTSRLYELPDDIMLVVLSKLDTADIVAFSDAVPTLKSMLHSYDFIRVRELQCFCLKENFMETKLGVDVSVDGGKRPVFRSEFDLLSHVAYYQYDVRKSIQGVEFDFWLPLPLSRRHWSRVRADVDDSLASLRRAAHLDGQEKVNVLYHFMNNIVVQFSTDADRSLYRADSRSTLNHASEKAVESYFALFHLLICLACEDPSIIATANQMVARFAAGHCNKNAFPDLGHLFI